MAQYVFMLPFDLDFELSNQLNKRRLVRYLQSIPLPSLTRPVEKYDGDSIPRRSTQWAYRPAISRSAIRRMQVIIRTTEAVHHWRMYSLKLFCLTSRMVKGSRWMVYYYRE